MLQRLQFSLLLRLLPLLPLLLLLLLLLVLLLLLLLPLAVVLRKSHRSVPEQVPAMAATSPPLNGARSRVAGGTGQSAAPFPISCSAPSTAPSSKPPWTLHLPSSLRVHVPPHPSPRRGRRRARPARPRSALSVLSGSRELYASDGGGPSSGCARSWGSATSLRAQRVCLAGRPLHRGEPLAASQTARMRSRPRKGASCGGQGA